MFRATLKSLLARKIRLILSGMAVVLAVTFVSGAFVLNETLGRSFDALFSSVYDDIDIQVIAKQEVATGGGGPAVTPVNLDANLVTAIAGVPGVAAARGDVTVEGARVVKDKKVVPSTGAPQFGASWTGQDPALRLRTGAGPTAPDQIVLNAGLAKAGNIKVGEVVDVITRTGRQPFTVVGIFEYSGGRDSIGGEQIVGFTEPVAQQLMLGAPGVFSAITVDVESGASKSAIRDTLRERLGGQYTVSTGEELAKQSADQIRAFLDIITYVLLGFAAVAVLVGVFLILNTFSIIVAQRTQELALLRALGASQRQVIGSVLLESVAIGTVASLVGLGLGAGLGALGAYGLATFTGDLEVAPISMPWLGVLISMLVGIGVTVVAALVPALRASRIEPVAALREAAATDRPLTKVTISGAVVTALGATLLGVGLAGKAGDQTLLVVLAGVLVCFIGVALLTPIIARPVVGVLGRLFSWSVPGMLGRRNSARNPRRTAITAAALMIGIALITAISTIFSSVQSSITTLVDKQLKADLVIAGQQTSNVPPSIDPGALEQIRRLPEVATMTAASYDSAEVAGRSTFLVAWDDLAAARQVLGLKATDGQITTLASGQIIMNEATAEDFKVSVGDSLSVQLAKAPERQYQVIGIYADTEIGDGMVISWADAAAGFGFSQPAQAYLKLRSGASADAVKQQVAVFLEASPEVTVQTRSEFVDQSTQIFDFILAAVQVLLGVALIIAVLGIVNTLALSVLERTRELGMLRAIGLRRAQLMRMITVESVVISLFGALLGLVVGGGLGTAVVYALEDIGITSISLPWTLMAVYLVAAAIVGVLAAVIPAIRAARLNVLDAISYE